MAHIPLRARDGSVRAWATVDADDFDRLSTHRWSLASTGYAVRSTNIGDTNLFYLMHRVIADLDQGDARVVDHINRDKLDNRRANLRVVESWENAKNRDKAPSSEYPGVSWCRRTSRWQAHVYSGGKATFVGRFDCEADAFSAREAARMAA